MKRFAGIGSLEARVVTPACGRLRWMVQDLGWRLSMASEGLDGELRVLTESVLDQLADIIGSATLTGTDEAVLQGLGPRPA